MMSTPMPITRAYEEMINFLAAGVTPQGLIDFQPSETVKERVAALEVEQA